MLLLNAGHEATVNATGIGWWTLFRTPGALERLRADRSLLPTAVDELLRFDTPVQMFERWVLEDVEITGCAMPRGAELGLLFGSANRDPAVFDAPDELASTASRTRTSRSARASTSAWVRRSPARSSRRRSARCSTASRPRARRGARWKPGYIIRGLESLRVTC